MAIIPLKSADEKPALGISACLMGEKVRFNGGHKRSSLCMNVLSDYFSFTRVCPEVAIGLGVPRKPIRLTGDANAYAATGTEDPGLDVTQPLADYAKNRAKDLHERLSTPVSGYILMQKSPSCGMGRVKIYDKKGIPHGDSGPGIFARALMETLPLLPVEEERHLHDAVLRGNFFTRVYAYYRWQQLIKGELSYQTIETFYARYKYVFMAHDPAGYNTLGNYLARNAQQPLEELKEGFFIRFMAMLGKHANRKSHTNVLLHLAGYLKKTIDTETTQELLTEIEVYRTGIHPLIVPIRLLRHYLMKYGNDYVKQQYYLNPYPDGLGLRNTV